MLLEMLLLLLHLGFFLLLAPMTTPCSTSGMGGASASKEEATARTSTHKACPSNRYSSDTISNSLSWELGSAPRWVLPSLREAGTQLWPPVLLKVVCGEKAGPSGRVSRNGLFVPVCLKSRVN